MIHADTADFPRRNLHTLAIFNRDPAPEIHLGWCDAECDATERNVARHITDHDRNALPLLRSFARANRSPGCLLFVLLKHGGAFHVLRTNAARQPHVEKPKTRGLYPE